MKQLIIIPLSLPSLISNRKIGKKWKAYRPTHLIIQVFCERNRQTAKERKPGRNKLREKKKQREREKHYRIYSKSF